ncbi:MAG: glycosyltransferase family 2 protein [Candidatus Omnitrophota bacterium]
MRLSVTIATKNNESNIKECLDSIKWADEIIIIDDMSKDKTLGIAMAYTVNIFKQDSHGIVHNNKNLAIEKASGEWILSLDADEVITQELASEIKEAIKDKEILAYYLNRKNFFLGKWIKSCGWYPNHIIRLFKKGVTRWPLSIHETPQLEDKEKVSYLKEPFLHYSYYNFNQYIEKFNIYTSLLAKEKYIKGKRVDKKSFLLCFFVVPIVVFLKKYVILKGYTDGFRGFFISLSSALTVILSSVKLWEIQNRPGYERNV